MRIEIEVSFSIYFIYLIFLWKKRESVTRLPCAWSANMEKNPSQAILDHSRFRKSQRSQRADPVMWILIHSHAQPSGFTRISSSTKLRLRLLLGTLSSGNADGDGNAETCEKAGERTPLWREFTNTKQHRRKPRFPHCQAYWHYWYSSSVYQDELGWLHWKEFAINSW